ncbi:MAG: Ig-like domain-containing protein, partial [Planctomycetaceae bacterium]|nr:Ig-like domain-containing protein [Planctomycetaceae bacterium]
MRPWLVECLESRTLLAASIGDVDGDNDFDANDSFLIHLVKLAGTDSHIAQLKGASPRSAAQIRSSIQALQAEGDVDGDFDFDANDSFLVHLVQLAGTDTQLELTKGGSPLTAAAIRSRIDRLKSVVSESAAAISSLSPTDGEEMVSVTRETIVRFNAAVDPQTVTSDAFFLLANGKRMPGQIRVSSTEKFATIVYDSPLPASTEIQVVVNGDQITARNGLAVDADGDGQPGGILRTQFRTLPLTRIPGTNVFGYVRDSVTGQPIEGVTIRVDAFPAANVVTDENGRFELVDMPAPEFFVHIDGSTSTSTPAGYVYPNVGKPFHSVPGQTVQLEMNREVFDIFLPPMAVADIVSLSETQTTQVGFGDAGRAELATMFPGVDPATWDRMQVSFSPGSAIDDQGNPSTAAAIIPVPPERIPGPLPPNLNPQLVVSIQASGATSFDVPAPVTFPNLEGLAPGEQSLIFSFDHDAGRWVVVGTGTVSSDGLTIESDPGVGIIAPGWHLTQPGVDAESGTPTEDPEWSDIQQILQDDYDSKRGTKDAALSHQILCIATTACNNAGPEGWGSGWVKDLFSEIAKDIDANRYETPIPDWIPDFFHTVWGGFGYHFVDHLLPGFIANCDRLDDDSDGDGITDHEEFFEQAVGPCFDEVSAAGEMSAFSAGSAKELIPAVATALREFAKKYCKGQDAISTISELVNATTALFDTGVRAVQYLGNVYETLSDFLNDVPNFNDPPFGVPVPFFERSYWDIPSVRSQSDFEISAAVDYFLEVGSEITLSLGITLPVQRSSVEYFVFADNDVATIDAAGMLRIHGTRSAFSAIPTPLYVLARVGDRIGFRQFAVLDADRDGDGLGDFYEEHTGLNSQQFNSGQSDFDEDGLTDHVEAALRTSPQYRDTDRDGVSDQFEVAAFDDALRGPESTFRVLTELRYSLENISTGFVQRGVTDLNGSLATLVLAPDATYRLSLLDLKTLKSGHYEFQTPASGSLFRIPTIQVRESSSSDVDQDGLGLDAELILGTFPDNADSDNDGIPDGAEVAQGLDPLGGRAFPTGVIASLPLLGEAREVILQADLQNGNGQLAWLATGSHGMAVVDATQFNNPIVLGQLELPGETTDIAVDSIRQRAVVAAGDAGL